MGRDGPLREDGHTELPNVFRHLAHPIARINPSFHEPIMLNRKITTRAAFDGLCDRIHLLQQHVEVMRPDDSTSRQAHDHAVIVQVLEELDILLRVVALAIEALVATFRAAHSDSTLLLHAAVMVFAVGTLVAGWGLFIHLNRSAEELEPEAMQEAKREDHKLK